MLFELISFSDEARWDKVGSDKSKNLAGAFCRGLAFQKYRINPPPLGGFARLIKQTVRLEISTDVSS
jgi:hypothetical protein